MFLTAKIVLIFFVLAQSASLSAESRLRVVTSTPDLAKLVESIGGDRVEVVALAKGTQDVHEIEAKPSFMLKISRADLVMTQGLDYEAAWMKPLLDGARNPKVLMGSAGYFELGPLLDPLEVKSGGVSRREGDVHPLGNPHFHLDPIRMAKAARLIGAKLSDLLPGDKLKFSTQAEKLASRLESKTAEWKERIRKTGIKELVSYHKSFLYFTNRFGLEVPIQLEPKPGIPPTTNHLLAVSEKIQSHKISLVWIENYYDPAVGEKLKQSLPHLRVKKVPVHVGGVEEAFDTESLIEFLVKSMEDKNL